jgi:NAD(P)H-hydrate repair Nnr-like enzyme with NAD(P)H-hydrate dehydratase domain
VGADLAYILTAREAAVPIKSYSPELMVTPVYDSADLHTRVG